MMRAVIILLFAGVAYSATSDDTSAGRPADDTDCTESMDIVNSCADDHLSYITNTGVFSAMKSIAEIDDPTYLLKENRLEAVCKDPEHLKMYFSCVFMNLTSCLEKANKTEISLPFAENIADGINTLCEHEKHINQSCILDQATEVEGCYQTATAAGGAQCTTYDGLVECSEQYMSSCDGGDYIVMYIKQGRPQLCGNSAGERSTALLATTLLALVTSVFVSRL